MPGDPSQSETRLAPPPEPEAPKPRPASSQPRTFFAKLRVWLKGAFVDNAALKLVALVLSLTVFVLVHSERDRSIVAYVGVSYTMPEDRVLVSRRVDQVRVTIEGSERRLRRFDEREMGRIHVDLTQEHDGEYVFDPDDIDLPEDLELLSISPSSMTLDFQPRVEKTVPVRLATIGRPARGYRVDRVTTEPARVAITGAESVVSSIDKVRTREVVLDGRTESFRVTIPLVAPRSSVELYDTKMVQAIVTITPDREQIRLEDVPVVAAAGAGLSEDQVAGVKVAPETVDLAVSGPVLALDQIEADAIRVEATVYPNDLAASGPRKAAVSVRGLPPGVTVQASPSEVTLTPP